MLIALQLCVALMLTATLVTVVTVLAPFELGRLVTWEDEQRQVDAADAPRIRKDARPARPKRAMRRTATVAVIAVFGTFGAVPLIHAEAPQECRYECGVDLEACKDGCIDSGGFEGCEEECGWVYGYCTDRCR